MFEWKIIAPVALAAAGAAAAALLLKKKPETAQAKPVSAAPSGAQKPAAVKNARLGTYSYVSGFQDPMPVEIGLTYDADRFTFETLNEEFLLPTSDTHVVVMQGEDFTMQIEYANLFGDDAFAVLRRESEEKYKDVVSVKYGNVEGFKYTSGDNICLCLPVDAESYLFVTMIKAKDSKLPLSSLPDHPDTVAIFSSMQVRK